MIDVYFHETFRPEDRAIRNFLWESYFHEAVLVRIDYGQPDQRDVTLVVRNDEDTWRLRFHRVVYFDHQTESGPCWDLSQEVFSTSFLNSPLLRRCQKDAGKPLYHLRIRLSCGLLDVVFQRFTVRREGGRVSYRPRSTRDESYDFDTSMGRLIAVMDEEPALRDRITLLACNLFRAQQAGDEAAIRRIARELITSRDVYSWVDYAAYMLGHHGDESDLPALMAIHSDPECTLVLRRELLDAMEHILERSAAHA